MTGFYLPSLARIYACSEFSMVKYEMFRESGELSMMFPSYQLGTELHDLVFCAGIRIQCTSSSLYECSVIYLVTITSRILPHKFRRYVGIKVTYFPSMNNNRHGSYNYVWDSHNFGIQFVLAKTSRSLHIFSIDRIFSGFSWLRMATVSNFSCHYWSLKGGGDGIYR